MLKKKFKFLLGQFYMVRIYDHGLGFKNIQMHDVLGCVIAQTNDELILSHWNLVSNDHEAVSQNNEPSAIIKSTIIKAKKCSW